MNKDFTNKRIGDICRILNGFAFKSEEYKNEGIRVMRITNVQKGELVDDDPKFFPIARKNEISRYMLQEGDVLMSLTGNVGRVGIMEEKFLPAALNQRVACLRLKDIGIDKKYLFHILNSDAFENDCIFNAAGIAQKNMSTKWLEQYEIPVPPIETQSRIVSELDLLQSIIDKQKAQLKELDNLAQAIFYDMFGNPMENEKGWKVKKMKDIAMVKIGPFGSLLHTSDYITGGTPLVNPIHMKNGQICTENSFTISDEKKKEMQPYLLKKGDVIFARRGEIGRCAIVSEKEDGYLCGTGSLFVRFTEPISEVFVLYLTKSDSFIKDLVSKAKGATMLNINCKIVEDQQLTLPPLPLQRSFAAKIESIEKQKAAISKSIEETQKLFDYTMDKYFG